jgi:hypothetical protein
MAFHTCDRSVEVSLTPFTQRLVACSPLFDAVVYLGLVTAVGYGREILYRV